MEAVKEILSNDKLEAMKEFSIKESGKILAHLQELKEQFETLDIGDTEDQLDTVIEYHRLYGEFEGIDIMIKELEHLAKNTYGIMR